MKNYFSRCSNCCSFTFSVIYQEAWRKISSFQWSSTTSTEWREHSWKTIEDIEVQLWQIKSSLYLGHVLFQQHLHWKIGTEQNLISSLIIPKKTTSTKFGLNRFWIYNPNVSRLCTTPLTFHATPLFLMQIAPLVLLYLLIYCVMTYCMWESWSCKRLID